VAHDPELRHRVAELYLPLRRFAAVVGPIDCEPDDLVQEAFVRALRIRPLSEYDNLGAYLRRVILSLAINQRRRATVGRRVVDRWRAGRTDAFEPTYPSDLADLLRLSPDARAVLWLVDVEGLPFREVAAIVDCSEATARARAMRARRVLRVALEDGTS
jgi:DNA-directed RNA polymerase specialized sigma24 family protein